MPEEARNKFSPGASRGNVGGPVDTDFGSVGQILDF